MNDETITRVARQLAQDVMDREAAARSAAVAKTMEIMSERARAAERYEKEYMGEEMFRRSALHRGIHDFY